MGKLIDLPKSEKVFKIVCNKTNTEAEIIIYNDIGKDSWFGEAFGAKDLDEELKKLPKSVKNLNVRINSGGGSVFEGYTIYNRLKQHSAKVTVYIDGMCASIASVIAMAGDEIIMGEASAIMIHKPWAPIAGNADELERMAELLDDLEEQMLNVYRKKTNKDTTELRQMLAEETWFFGQEAVDHGFATRMSEDGELYAVSASTDKKWFKHKPEMPLQNEAKEKIQSFKEDVKGFLARR